MREAQEGKQILRSAQDDNQKLPRGSGPGIAVREKKGTTFIVPLSQHLALEIAGYSPFAGVNSMLVI